MDEVLKFIETATLDQLYEIRKVSNRKILVYNKNKRSDLTVVKYTQWDMTMASGMDKVIQSNFPNMRPRPQSDIESWADEFRKLRTIDGYSEQIIMEVTGFALRDNFWKRNILSAKKLRQQFDSLLAKQAGGGNNII